jgi:hypothetical protein
VTNYYGAVTTIHFIRPSFKIDILNRILTGTIPGVLWEYSYKRLKSAQLLTQLGVFLTRRWPQRTRSRRAAKQADRGR